MKTLLLIRHAKSSWDDMSLPDFKRPLNSRGRKDAPEMAQRLRQKGYFPDLMLSSPATRAITTAKLMADVTGYPAATIEEEPELYHAWPEQMAKVISRLEEPSQVWLFAHNPGITDFANDFSNARIDNIPTCGVFAIQFDISKWQELSSVKGRFLFFDFPKSTTTL